MDFFEAQGKARSMSRRLVLLYALAVGFIIVGVYLVVLVVLGWSAMEMEAELPVRTLFHPGIFAGVAAGTLLLIGGGSAYRIAQLRRGGPAVAELLGGRRVDPATTELLERRLLNVVEEMAIASGIPVPAVYVLDQESGINAFAAGHTIHDAAVAVTGGALETLTRDELQGVMAHEFSHVLNGDMRLNVRLMGILFGILLLTVVGRGILRGTHFSGGGRRRGGRDGNGGRIALLGIALVVLGYVGVFFGRLIQAAVSRQREFLADAAAVQFTRNPLGIGGALRKIGGAAEGSRLRDHHAQEASHLFFAAGLRAALGGAFSTHPPLAARIQRIDPGWDGTFLEPKPVAGALGEPATGHREGSGPTGSGVGGEGHGGALPLPFPLPGFPGKSGGWGWPAMTAGAAAVTAAGTLGAGHIVKARDILRAIPESVRTETRHGEGAVAVVVALLLSERPDVRARQEPGVQRTLGAETLARVRGLRAQVIEAGAGARLPLLELCLPALRTLDAGRAEAVRAAIGPLTRADGEVQAFDFALFHLLRRALPGGPDPASAARVGPGLARRRTEAETLLSAVAWTGSDDPERAQAAFRAGAARFGPRAAAAVSLQPAGGLDLERVDDALSRLESLPPQDRRKLLDALEHTVRSDREVRVQELELLRAVAEALDVPMPPLEVTGS